MQKVGSSIQRCNVRSWHLADMERCPSRVRYRGQSGHGPDALRCLLLTQSGPFPRQPLEASCPPFQLVGLVIQEAEETGTNETNFDLRCSGTGCVAGHRVSAADGAETGFTGNDRGVEHSDYSEAGVLSASGASEEADLLGASSLHSGVHKKLASCSARAGTHPD